MQASLGHSYLEMFQTLPTVLRVKCKFLSVSLCDPSVPTCSYPHLAFHLLLHGAALSSLIRKPPSGPIPSCVALYPRDPLPTSFTYLSPPPCFALELRLNVTSSGKCSDLPNSSWLDLHPLLCAILTNPRLHFTSNCNCITAVII